MTPFNENMFDLLKSSLKLDSVLFAGASGNFQTDHYQEYWNIIQSNFYHTSL